MKKASGKNKKTKKPVRRRAKQKSQSRTSSVDARARVLLRQSYEVEDSEERLALLQDAVAIDQNCIEALNLLGCQENDIHSAERMFDRAIAAGATKFPTGLSDWADDEYVAYSAALSNSAKIREIQCQFDAAIELLETILKHEMPDAVRSLGKLLTLYLQTRRYDKAEKMLDELEDEDSDGEALFDYSRLLIALNTGASEEECHRLFLHAMSVMPDVAEYLTGNQELPSEVSIDDYESIVASVALMLNPAWRATDRPVLWLRSAFAKYQEEAGVDDDDLLDLDVESLIEEAVGQRKSKATWRFECVTCKQGVAYVVFDSDNESIVYYWIGPNADGLALRVLLMAMVEPMDGEPVRPATVETSDGLLAEEFRSELSSMKLRFKTSPFENVELLTKTIEQMEHTFEAGPIENEPEIVQTILNLPMDTETEFVVVIKQVPSFVDDHGTAVRPYLGAVIDASTTEIRSQLFSPALPEQSQLKRLVCDAILSPLSGAPVRPTIMEFSSPDNAIAIQDWLTGLSIATTIGSRYQDTMDRLIEMLMDSDEKFYLPSITTVDGATDERLEDFYDASRNFFVTKPWTAVPAVNCFEVQCDSLLNEPLYCVVMGQMSEVTGIAFFESYEEYLLAIRQDSDDEDEFEEVDAASFESYSLMFSEESEIHPADLNYIENNGIAIAGAFAYPAITFAAEGVLTQCSLSQFAIVAMATRILAEYFSQPFHPRKDIDAPRSIEVTVGEQKRKATVTFRQEFQ